MSSTFSMVVPFPVMTRIATALGTADAIVHATAMRGCERRSRVAAARGLGGCVVSTMIGCASSVGPTNARDGAATSVVVVAPAAASSTVDRGVPPAPPSIGEMCIAGEQLGAVGYDVASDVVTVCFADSYRCAALPAAGPPRQASGTNPRPAVAPKGGDRSGESLYDVDTDTRLAVTRDARVCAAVLTATRGDGGTEWKRAAPRCVNVCP